MKNCNLLALVTFVVVLGGNVRAEEYPKVKFAGQEWERRPAGLWKSEKMFISISTGNPRLDEAAKISEKEVEFTGGPLTIFQFTGIDLVVEVDGKEVKCGESDGVKSTLIKNGAKVKLTKAPAKKK